VNTKNKHLGKILHLDGDKRYAEKSARFYKSLGLNAIVKNIPESKQAELIIDLLNKYEPDILVITGHDEMIKKGTNFYDIYNYRNSKYFINTVCQARKWNNPKAKNLAIFAGACQSFYEALISAGANFASSPKRIMIDFIDPLIVAERIATTESTKYLTIQDIENELKDGRNGIDGIGTTGKKRTLK
jgi:spore coat assembly protein